MTNKKPKKKANILAYDSSTDSDDDLNPEVVKVLDKDLQKLPKSATPSIDQLNIINITANAPSGLTSNSNVTNTPNKLAATTSTTKPNERLIPRINPKPRSIPSNVTNSNAEQGTTPIEPTQKYFLPRTTTSQNQQSSPISNAKTKDQPNETGIIIIWSDSEDDEANVLWENSDKKPELNGSDNKPQLNGSDKRPQLNGSDKRPQLNASDKRPQLHGSDKRPQLNRSDKRPQLNGSDKRPQLHGSDKRPQLNRSDKRPQLNGSDKRPQLYGNKTGQLNGDKQPPQLNGNKSQKSDNKPPEDEPPDAHGIKKERRFRPKLYDFLFEDYDEIRDILIENERKYDDNIVIRCPEFAILLDHAIAMIWYFYRDWKHWNIFNVPQLEWVIKFLSGIANQGTYTHIETMIQQLQELLFIIYTEVPEDLIGTPEPKRPQQGQSVPELPVSLKAMLNRAPEFTKYLSTTAVSCDRPANNAAQSDHYADARIQLMRNELEKLNKYSEQYELSLTRYAELSEIINNIKRHADELVRAREDCL